MERDVGFYSGRRWFVLKRPRRDIPTGGVQLLRTVKTETGCVLRMVKSRKAQRSKPKGTLESEMRIARSFWGRAIDDDDVYYYIRWRLKLEGETEYMGVR